MVQIKWQEKMSLEYPPIDEEHQRFLVVVNEAQEAAEKEDFMRFESIFEKCYNYVRSHFPQEEDLMERMRFPDLEAHIKSHQQFIENISQLRTLYSQAKEWSEYRIITRKTADYLSAWFLGHILSRDRNYKPYLVRLRSLPPRMNYPE